MSARGPILRPDRIDRLGGFGRSVAFDAYVVQPTTVDEVHRVFDEARQTGRLVVLRGSGRSYGDAATMPEAIAVDMTRMDRILAWDPESGVIEVEGGVTLGAIWKHTLADGWWLPVVSGTMAPTIGGALAMNIHGKNHFTAGSLGEHVLELDLATPGGETPTLRPREDGLFEAVVGSAGLLGVITRVRMQMKRVRSGDLRVLPISCPNWEAQFEAFERLTSDPDRPDYLVSWIDGFARGSKAGRGLVHAAWYREEDSAASLALQHQELPDTILGIVPKSSMWRWLKPWTNRFGMRLVNAAKYRSAKILHDGKPTAESLAGFSFLLDYVPNWERAYGRGGLIQYQSFVPQEAAARVFPLQIAMAQEARLEPFLAVMKRHRPDPFLLTWALDGYSLAMDFKVTERNWLRLRELCWQMNTLVLDHGGRFYFAKDSTLRPSDVRTFLGDGVLAEFRALKRHLDPDGLLGSALAERVGLIE